jgi:hypothetical protein
MVFLLHGFLENKKCGTITLQLLLKTVITVIYWVMAKPNVWVMCMEDNAEAVHAVLASYAYVETYFIGHPWVVM